MQLHIITPGKTTNKALASLIGTYVKRVRHFHPLQYQELQSPKIKHYQQSYRQVEAEGELLLQHIAPDAHLILLDERGQSITSPQWAALLESAMVQSVRQLVFCVGGAHGFSDALYTRANRQMALSSLTLPHEMARLILCEQLYRAFTILRGIPYHH